VSDILLVGADFFSATRVIYYSHNYGKSMKIPSMVFQPVGF
jgi:hypothetical protein